LGDECTFHDYHTDQKCCHWQHVAIDSDADWLVVSTPRHKKDQLGLFFETEMRHWNTKNLEQHHPEDLYVHLPVYSLYSEQGKEMAAVVMLINVGQTCVEQGQGRG
jgi:hypothetical protein